MAAPPGIARTQASGGSKSAEGGSWIAPHVSQQARDHLDDLGLVENDNTEDMRPNVNAPGRCWNTAEGDSNNPPNQEQEF